MWLDDLVHGFPRHAEIEILLHFVKHFNREIQPAMIRI